MFEAEIESKNEINIKLRCITCLSFGRKMVRIGKYLHTFSSLLPERCFQVCLEDTTLCWECHSKVRHIALFQDQVQRANNLLQSGQSHIYGTLSNLTTIIKTDIEPSTVYVYDTKVPIKVENDEVDELNNETFTSPSSDCGNIDEDIPENCELSATVNNSEVATEKVIIKKTYNNKWAKKRALQNMKPKFKILNAIEVNFKTMFKEKLDDDISKRHIECTQCKLEFESDNIIMRHFKEKHANELFCNVCYSLLSDNSTLLSHMKIHTIYNCNLCDYTCRNEKKAHSHINKRHPHIYHCIKCQLKFPSRRVFFQHYKDWHEKYICDYCGVSFKMRYCIKDHIRKQHSPFVCLPCNKQFARYNGLWLHNKVRHCSLAPPAYCVECDRHYPDVYRYKWHLTNSAKHNPRKRARIPCPGCDKVFSKNIYMKDHHNMIHLKLYNYRCEDCDKNFIRNADLVKHKRRVHDGILPPKNKICYICGKGFTTNKILSNHLRTHSGAVNQSKDSTAPTK